MEQAAFDPEQAAAVLHRWRRFLKRLREAYSSWSELLERQSRMLDEGKVDAVVRLVSRETEHVGHIEGLQKVIASLENRYAALCGVSASYPEDINAGRREIAGIREHIATLSRANRQKLSRQLESHRQKIAELRVPRRSFYVGAASGQMVDIQS